MRDWQRDARAWIRDIEASMSPGATLEDRRRACRSRAFDFHMGTSWGQRVWSKHVRAYLEQHGLPPRTLTGDDGKQKPSKVARRIADGDIAFPFRKQP